MDGRTQANRHQHGDFDVGFTFGVDKGWSVRSGLPYFSTFRQSTTRGWCLIRLIWWYTTTSLRSTNRLSYMATWKRQSQLKFQSRGERVWNWGSTLTATMPETKQKIGQGMGSLSSWTPLWSSGFPRSNLQLRHQFLVQIFCRRNMERKHSMGSDTSWGWWGFLTKDPTTSMETTCQLYTTTSDHILWGKRVTQHATMLWERALRWVSCWQLTTQQVRILRTCWWRYFTEENEGITWATCYNIYMMIKSWNKNERYHTLKENCECYHSGQHFTLEGTENFVILQW